MTIAKRRIFWSLLAVIPVRYCTESAYAESATAISADRVVPVANAIVDGDELWVTPADLTRINGFVLKPEGACLPELCIPVSRRPEDRFLRTEQGQEYISLAKLSAKLDQAVVVDREHRVWSFGPLSISGAGALDSGLAPEFTLPDRQGRPVRLSSFRGKKVLLLSWASW